MSNNTPAFIDSNNQVVKVSTNTSDVLNVSPVPQNNDLIYRLNPVSFNFPNSNTMHYDLLADEVASVIPEAVDSLDRPNYIKYQSLISLLINTVKEQKRQITQLEESIRELFIRIK